MSGQKLEFPYEMRDVDQHEKEVLRKLFSEETPDRCEYIRVGPKGYLLYKEYEKEASNIYNMEIRLTDVFVASYQRSGTTWAQELVWLLVKNLDFETAKAELLTRRYPFLEMSTTFNKPMQEQFVEMSNDKEEARKMVTMIATPATKILPTMPDPRFVKTHLPMSLLPPYLLDKAKMVYVARDPRDVIVSCYHHTKLFRGPHGFKADFKQFWNLFPKNLFILTPYFENVKEAWAQRHHPNMLFLFYEELSKDLPASIRRVAHFFGKELTDEQIAPLCDHLSIENFKKNTAVNFEDVRPLGGLASGETFIRKGKSGGWRDYFDEEMTRESQRWIDENLRGTDLSFPSMKN